MSFGNLGLLLAFWIPAFAGMTGGMGWDGMGWDGSVDSLFRYIHTSPLTIM